MGKTPALAARKVFFMYHRPDGVAVLVQAPLQRSLWMLNVLNGRYILVVILALIKRSIKTTITKVLLKYKLNELYMDIVKN